MKFPIIISEHGDLNLYESLEIAERAVEAIDVQNNEYVAFDSEGRLLNISVAPTKAWFVALDGVKILAGEQDPTHQTELAQLIRNFLESIGPEDPDMLQMSLPDLVVRLQGRISGVIKGTI